MKKFPLKAVLTSLLVSTSPEAFSGQDPYKIPGDYELRFSCLSDLTKNAVRIEVYRKDHRKSLFHSYKVNKRMNAGYLTNQKLGDSVRMTTGQDHHFPTSLIFHNPEGSRELTGVLETPNSVTPLSCIDHSKGKYQVTVYKHFNFTGPNASLSTGFNNVADLTGEDGVGDNSISGLRIPKGVIAIACSQDYGKGKCFAYPKSRHWMKRGENDKISSIGVFRIAK